MRNKSSLSFVGSLVSIVFCICTVGATPMQSAESDNSKFPKSEGQTIANRFIETTRNNKTVSLSLMNDSIVDSDRPSASVIQAALATNRKSSNQRIDQIMVKFFRPDAHRVALPSYISSPDTVPIGHQLNEKTLSELQYWSGIELLHEREMSGDAHVLRFKLPQSLDEVSQVLTRIRAMADVEYAAANEIVSLADDVNDESIIPQGDSLYYDQWSLHQQSVNEYGIDMPAAWDITTGNPSMVIAVVDTGVLLNHAELSGRLLPGYDFISDPARALDGNGRDNDPSDAGNWCVDRAGRLIRTSTWHGTHVSGIIAANPNGEGMAGVNWKSKILPVRVLGACGSGSIADIIDGMNWAIGLSVPGVPKNPYPAKVVNLSLGSSFSFEVCNPAYQNAINQAYAKGSILIVSAGNESVSALSGSLAGCQHVIVVAASNRAGNLASYSNYGYWIDVTAPGGESGDKEGIVSAYNDGATKPTANNYKFLNGTSMAAPQVSGVVSLMLAANPKLSFEQIVGVLRYTAQPFKPGDPCPDSLSGGAGIINASRAIELARILPAPLRNIYLPTMHLDDITPLDRSRLQAIGLTNAGFECRSVGWRVNFDLSKVSKEEFSNYVQGAWPFINRLNANDYKNRAWVPKSGDWFFGVKYPPDGFLDVDVRLVQQFVTIPANARKLTFWAMIESEEDDCKKDGLWFQFGDDTKNWSYLGLCNARNTGQNNWRSYQIDVTRLAGQSLVFGLIYQANGAIPSQVFIDDIAFE
jgi:serine protease